MNYPFETKEELQNAILNHSKPEIIEKYGYPKDWNTSKITDMKSLFHIHNYSFNDDPINISNWDVSNVTNIGFLFVHVIFNDNVIMNLSNWDVSNVENMEYLFSNSTLEFDIGIDKWNVSKVKYMDKLFKECNINYDINLNTWCVSNVTDMSDMFKNANISNLKLDKWDTSNVEDMSGMFNKCNIGSKLDISNWNVSKVKNMSDMFILNNDDKTNNHSDYLKNTKNNYLKDMDFSKWDTSNVEDMAQMFVYCYINSSINNFNVSNVKCMNVMFSGCVFDSKVYLGNWNIINLKLIDMMFAYSHFNGNLGLNKWEVNNIKSMRHLFSGSNWNYDLSSWDINILILVNKLFENVNIKDEYKPRSHPFINIIDIKKNEKEIEKCYITNKIIKRRNYFIKCDKCQKVFTIDGIKSWLIDDKCLHCKTQWKDIIIYLNKYINLDGFFD